MRMLPGTEEATEREITMELKLNGVRWMLVGKYKGEFIFETDENTISTNHITEQQMYDLKKIHFLTNLFGQWGLEKAFLKLDNFLKLSIRCYN